MVGKGPFSTSGWTRLDSSAETPASFLRVLQGTQGLLLQPQPPALALSAQGYLSPQGRPCGVDSKGTSEDPQRVGAEQEARTG